MIALHDHLPLVRFSNGDTTAFRQDWLKRSLVEAASQAGYPKWWLAEHITESVVDYLRNRFEENVVSVDRLSKAVKSMLQVIGYAEVSEHFVPAPPVARISLPEIARKAGSGYELAFFEMLTRTLHHAMAGQTNCLELVGLERCVRQLRARKIWSRDCNSLREEIVLFVRKQLSATSGSQPVSLHLS